MSHHRVLFGLPVCENAYIVKLVKIQFQKYSHSKEEVLFYLLTNSSSKNSVYDLSYEG